MNVETVREFECPRGRWSLGKLAYGIMEGSSNGRKKLPI